MVNGQCFEQNLNDFLELFSKKCRFHIPGVFAPLPCTVYLVIGGGGVLIINTPVLESQFFEKVFLSLMLVIFYVSEFNYFFFLGLST